MGKTAQEKKLKSGPCALVVGGAGFVGSYLCEELLKANLPVICFDNLKTGSKENLKNCLINEDFIFVDGDVNDWESLKVVEKKDIRYVFHLAGVEEYFGGKGFGAESLKVNSAGTRNLLELSGQKRAKFVFVSSIDVYVGKVGEEMILEKGEGEQERRFYSYGEAKRYGESLIKEYCGEKKVDARIVRVRDLYGPRMNLEAAGIGEILKGGVKERKLVISGEGGEIYYPLYISDFIEGIKRATFFNETRGKIYNFVNKDGVSEKKLVYLIEGLRPELEVVYRKEEFSSKEKLNVEELTSNLNEIDWEPETTLVDGIRKTLCYFFEKEGVKKETKVSMVIGREEEEEREKKEEKEVEKLIEVKKEKEERIGGVKKDRFGFLKKLFKKEKKKRKKIGWVLGFLFLLILISGLFFGGTIYWTVNNFSEAEKNLRKGDFDEAEVNFARVKGGLTNIGRIVNFFGFVFDMSGSKEEKQKILLLVDVGKEVAELGESGVRLIDKGVEVVKVVLSGKEEDVFEKIERIKVEVGEITGKAAAVEAGLEKLELSTIPTIYRGKIKEMKKRLPVVRKDLKQVKNFLTVAAAIIRVAGKREYLILFQNNMEIRATGGFIGSFGLATFDKGSLKEFKVEDVYTVDGQLKGKVDPPDEILHFLGQPKWFLRDSNFSPDFKLSGKRAMWFFEKGTGGEVDGVIGIDLTMARYLIDALGAVEVVDYGKKVNSENFFKIAEEESEKDFFSGSTQKKDFLGAVGRAMFDRIKNGDKVDYLALGAGALRGFNEKHGWFYFGDKKIEKAMEEAGWGGSNGLEETREEEDYLFIVDSNFGANKANYYVTKKIDHKIEIGKEGEIKERVKITYTNESPTDSWPGGVYKNYLRIYTPKDTDFIDFDLGDEREASLSGVLTEDVLEKVEKDKFLVLEGGEKERKYYGVFFEVPIKSEREVELTYKLPWGLNFRKSGAEYKLKVIKQPGSENDEYNLLIGYPAFLKAGEFSKGGVAQEQVISYNTNLVGDKEFWARFKK